mgnify:CR=1 FL=1
MVLETKEITAAYGESQILWGVNLKVQPATITTIMGRNGVGKTSLLKTLIGLLKNTEGEIIYEGQDISKLAPHKRAKLGIGYVPQGREIIPKLTVYENLKLGLESTTENTIPEEEIYELFPILKDFRKRLGGNLSGGQQQQLAIARAITGRPKLLLLDEPTEGIQPSISQEIAKILLRLKEEKNIATLLVEQKIDFAKGITDYYYFMNRGKVVAESKASEISIEEINSHNSI